MSIPDSLPRDDRDVILEEIAMWQRRSQIWVTLLNGANHPDERALYSSALTFAIQSIRALEAYLR